MVEYYSHKGSFNNVASDTRITRTANQLSGTYFDTNSVTVTSSGTIEVAIDSGVHQGQTFTMVPKTASDGRLVGWRCGGLGAQYLPSSCR